MFSYIKLGFKQSHSGSLGVIGGFVQKIQRLYKSDKPNNIVRMDRVHLKSDCINGKLVNEILYSFSLTNSLVIKHTSNRELD